VDKVGRIDTNVLEDLLAAKLDGLFFRCPTVAIIVNGVFVIFVRFALVLEVHLVRISYSEFR